MAVLLAVTASALAVPASAPAYRLSDIRPGPRLTYFIAHKSRAWDIREAAKMWNTSGARVRLTEVRSRPRAKIIVLGGKLDTAITGWNPGPHGGVVFPMYITLTTRKQRDHLNGAHIMAHEFGHVFGLEHNRGCSVMNATFKCQGDPKPGYWYCRGVQKDDVRGVASLYGGRWAPKRPAACLRSASGAPGADKEPPPGPPPAPAVAPPSELAAAVDASGDGSNLVVTLRAPPEPSLEAVVVFWRWGSCPVLADPDTWEGAESITSAAPGQPVRIDREVTPPAGERRLCVAAVSYGKDETTSTQVTAIVVFP